LQHKRVMVCLDAIIRTTMSWLNSRHTLRW
jgi:hypothetical protein